VADFIACQRTGHGVAHAVTCRALDVSESWFYKWLDRAPTAWQLRKAALCERVTKRLEVSGEVYGLPRIHQDLVDGGWAVSVNIVAQRMAELGLSGRKPLKRRGSIRQGKRPVARPGASELRRGRSGCAVVRRHDRDRHRRRAAVVRERDGSVQLSAAGLRPG